MEHVAAVKPHFVAIHCQEVGGKNSEKGMAHVPKFIESMRELGAEQVRSFTILGFNFHFFRNWEFDLTEPNFPPNWAI